MDKQKVIALTGTPGTGKTSAAKILKRKGFAVINLNSEIRRHKLYSGYDEKRKTYVADMRKAEGFLKRTIKSEKYEDKKIMIDSHISHLLPKRLVDAVVVLRCDPAEVEKRLKARGWSREKVRENVESEIIGLIEYEARKKHMKVFAIDTTKLGPEKAAEEMNKLIRRISAISGCGTNIESNFLVVSQNQAQFKLPTDEQRILFLHHL